MKNKQVKELNENIREVLKVVKNYNKLKHIFSDDKGVRALAKLNECVRKIQLLIKISGLKEIDHPQNKALIQHGKPCAVKVRPCGEKYGGKTYVGFLIGDIALSSAIKITENKIVCEWAYHNPAIYIPETGDVVYGAESWWSEIESEEDLKGVISDEDIQNVWYMQALKEISSKKEKQEQDR